MRNPLASGWPNLTEQITATKQEGLGRSERPGRQGEGRRAQGGDQDMASTPEALTSGMGVRAVQGHKSTG